MITKFSTSKLSYNQHYRTMMAPTSMGGYFIGYLDWNSTNSNNANAVAVDSTGNIWASGTIFTTSQDVSLLKLNNTGAIQAQSSTDAGADDFAQSMFIDAANNVYIGGYTSAGANNTLTVKYNSSGVVQWKNIMGGAGTSEQGVGVTADSSGNVYVASTTTQPGFYFGHVQKFDSAGTRLWEYKWGPNGVNTWFNGMTGDSTGVFYTVGMTLPASFYELKIIKWSNSGSVTWQRKLTGASVSILGYDAAIDASSNVYICGYSGATGLVVKYNSAGTIQWQRGLNNASFSKVKCDSAGNVYAVGQYTGGGGGWTIAKWDSSGAIQWQRKMLATNIGAPTGFVIDAAGNLIIGGTVNYNNSLVMKLPSDGSLTGSYIVGPYSFTYSITTETTSTPTFTDAADTPTPTTTSMSNTTSAATATATNLYWAKSA